MTTKKSETNRTARETELGDAAALALAHAEAAQMLMDDMDECLYSLGAALRCDDAEAMRNVAGASLREMTRRLLALRELGNGEVRLLESVVR